MGVLNETTKVEQSVNILIQKELLYYNKKLIRKKSSSQNRQKQIETFTTKILKQTIQLQSFTSESKKNCQTLIAQPLKVNYVIPT